MKPKMELEKPRDFGELISDTFLFFRENFKPLMKAFFTFCGFFLVATAVALSVQQVKMVNAMNSLSSPGNTEYQSIGPFDFLGWEFLIGILFLYLSTIAISLTVLCYMSIYKEKGNEAPTMEEIWGYFKYYFFRVTGSSFLLGAMLMLGFVFCLIPGFYLYPILALVFPIIVMENASFSYAFSRSFTLIKENWWVTFGALFVMGIIVAAARGIIQLPVSLYTVSSTLLYPTRGVNMSVTGAVIGVVLQQLCMIFYILPVITVALSYFSLNEIKEGTGILQRIHKFGQQQDGPDSNHPAEEY